VKLKLPLFLLIFQLSACGGGGGSGGAPQTPGPSDLVYPSPPVLIVGTAVTPLTPTVSGTVTQYAISPALPAGLSMSATTGEISGTPTAPAAKTGYTVTASSSSGSTSATVSIQVDSSAPIVSYPTTAITLTTSAAANIAPSSTGGTVVSWSIAPALPSGLTFDTATGAIVGTATTTSVAAPYVVTAINSGGKSQATLTIQVVSTVVLDLGHAAQITNLLVSGTRGLSEDLPDAGFYVGRCILWNITTDAMLTSAQCNGGQIALAGPTAVVPSGNGLQVLASSDGHLQATLAASYTWWQLASDGSYIAAGSASGLTAWSPTGQSLYSATGDYSKAMAFAAPGQILVALGPAGQNVIETVSLSARTSSTGPTFHGTFNEWFTDGSHFQTATGTTVWTYSSTSVQQDLTALSTVTGLSGQGNWFWTNTGIVNFYAVGSSATPALTSNVGFGLVIPSATTVALLPDGSPQVTVVDLSGTSLAQSTATLPSTVALTRNTAYAAISASNWFVGNSYGVLIDGKTLASTPKYLTYGASFSMAGGGAVAAVATASGRIVVISPQTSAVQTTIDLLSANIQMSLDGTVLAAMGLSNGTQYQPDESIKVFSLPTGSVINAWPYSYNSAVQLLGYTLAPTGTLVAQLTGTYFPPPGPTNVPPYLRQVTAVTGGAVLWSDSHNVAYPSVLFSPDGTLIAAAAGLQAPGTATNIYHNYALTTAVAGWPVGWIDNSRLLTNTYIATVEYPDQYSGATIYSSSGTILATPAFPGPGLQNLEAVSVDSIYSPFTNSIYSLTTGGLIFGNGDGVSSPNVGGALVGSYLVYPSGALVVAVQY
jgi:Putative Ig domain